jgi:hypothetical protein
MHALKYAAAVFTVSLLVASERLLKVVEPAPAQ